MIVAILDYVNADVVIRNVPAGAEVEEYIYDTLGYKEDDIAYMCASEITLDYDKEN